MPYGGLKNTLLQAIRQFSNLSGRQTRNCEGFFMNPSECAMLSIINAQIFSQASNEFLYTT
jgi:hypothetical protein